MDILHFNTKWISFIIWFLHGWLCECYVLPDVEPAMFGEITSPQYPRPYPPNVQEEWDLNVPEGFQIQLTFTHMDIETSDGCYYDSLTVFSDGKLLEKFCGSENSADCHHPGHQSILSPGNTLTLVFQSDGTNPERHQNVGFNAHYQAVDIDECSAENPLCSQICLNTLGSYLCACHHGYKLRSDRSTCRISCGEGIFTEPEGHLTSPGYPEPSPHDLSCRYVISVKEGFFISLNFSQNFHIESIETDEGRYCLHHWLQVTVPNTEPFKLCGGKGPGLVTTKSHIVTLEYHIDGEGLSKGWSLDYSTDRVRCPAPGSVNKGTVTPSLTEYLYKDFIYVRCDQGYKLMMNDQEIPSFSTMCQNNGQWHLPLPECQIIDCGEPEPLLNGGFTHLSGSSNQYLSVVRYHCNEPFYTLFADRNATFTCEADRKWRPNHLGTTKALCLPVCGRPTRDFTHHKRIIGGGDAPVDTIPWQALLISDGHRGGAIVIADRWIMTAAHVLILQRQAVPKESVKIYVGITDVKAVTTTSLLIIDSIHIHPGYNNPKGSTYDNDVALIKLQRRLTFDASVMPVCLPTENHRYLTGHVGLVSGFGIEKVNGTRILPNTLKYVQLPLVDQETCNSSLSLLGEKRNVPELTDNMFCAGTPEGGKDSCQGDSGGPFTLTTDGQYWLAGIVSWGVDCGLKQSYGVYTKVVNYRDWINQTMEEN